VIRWKKVAAAAIGSADLVSGFEESHLAGQDVSLTDWVNTRRDRASNFEDDEGWTETVEGFLLSEPSRMFEWVRGDRKSTYEVGIVNPLMVSMVQQENRSSGWVVTSSYTITHTELLPAGSPKLPLSIFGG
jgi:hypothetical protein